MAVTTALEWLNSCAGCEMSLLDIGEELLELLTETLEIVHAPLLMDHKYFGQTGEGTVLTLPEAKIGLVSGGVNTSEHLAVLQEMRSRCETLVAIGTCATHGGIPALMNGRNRRQSWEEIFQSSTTDGGAEVPTDVPQPLDRVYAVDEKVSVDLYVPGCPPNSVSLAEVLRAVVEKRSVELPGKSVCDTCPVERKGKGEVRAIRRFTVNAGYEPHEPLSDMRCLLEQGFLCLGPVTRGGCTQHGAPRCIVARVPCRGCYGPVRRDGNQLLDMMNALASNGIDYRSVEDRRSVLRFSGAHGLLKPVRKRS